MIESWDHWKVIDIKERRIARVESNDFTKKSTKMAWMHEDKKAKLERNHQLTKMRAEKKAKILLELIKSNRSREEMQLLMSLME